MTPSPLPQGRGLSKHEGPITAYLSLAAKEAFARNMHVRLLQLNGEVDAVAVAVGASAPEKLGVPVTDSPGTGADATGGAIDPRVLDAVRDDVQVRACRRMLCAAPTTRARVAA